MLVPSSCFLPWCRFVAALLLLCGGGTSKQLLAQEAALVFDHLTIDQGLSNNVAVDIVQDIQGFMWISTHNGLNRYDGRTVKQFYADPTDSTSLDSDNLSNLHVDQKGQLWVSSKGGYLHRYDPATESFMRYPMPLDGKGRAIVEYIHESVDGTFWLASWYRGLWKFDPETGALVNYRHDPDDPSSIGHDVVKDIVENPDGTLWVATYGGLNHFDPRTGRAKRYPIPVGPNLNPHLRPSIMWDVHRDRWGTLWVGTFGGLYRFSPETGAYTPYLPNPANPNTPGHYEVREVSEDHTGALWIGYANGLDRFDPQAGTFEHFSHDPFSSTSLPQGSINPIYQDRTGVLWVGSDRQGFSRIDLVAQRIQYDHANPGHPEGLRPGLIHAVHEDQAGNLWLGGEAGLTRVTSRTGTIAYFTPEANNLPRGIITDIHEDTDGTLWVTSEGRGIGRLKSDETFEQFGFEKERDNFLYNLVPAQRGGYWVGGFDGFFRWVPETGIVEAYRADPVNPEALAHSFIMALYEDAAGMVWVGTEVGLTRLNPTTQQITNYLNNSDDTTSIQSGPITTIHKEREGTLWVAGSGGISRFDARTNKFTRFSGVNALPTNIVYGFMEDQDGMFWLHTNLGILRFDPATGAAQNVEPNIVSMPADISFGAFHQTRAGRMFFGALNGFYSFSPQELSVNPYPPAVALTQLRVADAVVGPEPNGRLAKAINVAERVRLSYQDRLFALDFAALHFSKPAQNTFSFWLEGFDDTWRGPTANASVTYTNLDPGTYTFHVRAANRDGIWSKEAATLAIEIEPPWWGTLWFRLLMAASLVGAIAGAYSWRVRTMRQQNHALEAQVRERTHEIEAQRTTLEIQARKLLATDKLKSNFFANTSHELRTPLTLIRGNLEDIIDDTELRINARTWERLNVAMGQTERLQQLVEQLLDLARLQSDQMQLRAQYGDLGQFLERLLSAFDSVAQQQKITLHFTRSESPTWVYFDPDKLEKIVTNLIGNALKFTPAGGRIDVTVNEEARSGDGYGTGQFVALQVADNGEGISPDALPHIFERFYQADGSLTRTREGMGLGLALAKELTDLHGGEIRSTSIVGYGTTFIVLLPKGRAHLADHEIVTSPTGTEAPDVVSSTGISALLHTGQTTTISSEQEAPHPYTLLIVEDNADLRHYMCTHLRSSYDVLEAENGVVGLKHAQQYRPDLILSDVMMPKMDGFSLLRAVKADPDLALIPVVLLTAKATEADQQEGLEAEAAHYIAKPFKMADVKLRIHNLLADRARMKEALHQQALRGVSEDPDMEPADALFLNKARSFIEAHLQDNAFNVSSLAEALFVSESTLRRRLQDLMGMSAAAYIRQIRLNKAKHYLEQQRYKTVAEVATAVGFSNPHYFSRVFRQTFEISPSNLLRSGG